MGTESLILLSLTLEKKKKFDGEVFLPLADLEELLPNSL